MCTQRGTHLNNSITDESYHSPALQTITAQSIRTLVNRYTTEGELVMDFYDAVAKTSMVCSLSRRPCVCYEPDAKYFDLGKKHLYVYASTLPMEKPPTPPTSPPFITEAVEMLTVSEWMDGIPQQDEVR